MIPVTSAAGINVPALTTYGEDGDADACGAGVARPASPAGAVASWGAAVAFRSECGAAVAAPVGDPYADSSARIIESAKAV